jgi:hypothetical protein
MVQGGNREEKVTHNDKCLLADEARFIHYIQDE